MLTPIRNKIELFNILKNNDLTTDEIKEITNIDFDKMEDFIFNKYSIAFSCLINELIKEKNFKNNIKETSLTDITVSKNENNDFEVNETVSYENRNLDILTTFFENNKLNNYKLTDISRETGLSKVEITMLLNKNPKLQTYYKSILQTKVYETIENVAEASQLETYEDSEKHKYRATQILINNLSTPITIKKDEDMINNNNKPLYNLNFNIFDKNKENNIKRINNNKDGFDDVLIIDK